MTETPSPRQTPRQLAEAVQQAIDDFERRVASAEGAYGDARGVHYQRKDGQGFNVQYYGAITDLKLVTAALSSASAAKDWQPIETAPKDGTPILVLLPCGDERQVETARFVGNALVQTWEHALLARATHWMPLPAPPALSEGTR